MKGKLIMELFNKSVNNNAEILNNIDNTCEANENDSSIINNANYTLVNVQKDKIEENSITISLDDIATVTNEIKEFINILKNKCDNKDNMYQIERFSDPKAIIAFFNEPENKIKDLKKLGFNPATIMITVSLYEIEKEILEIKSICNNILSFLENDKEAQIEADVKTLIRVVTEYKYNWQDEQYIDNNHKLIMDIQRTAITNISFYQKQININIKKSKIFMTNKGIDEDQNKLEKLFKYYKLTLYVYSFATFLEIILLENFQKEFLKIKEEELKKLSDEYINYYQEALKHVKKEARKSIQGNLLSGIGSAGKAIGDIAEKVQVIKDKKIDTWFNKNGENLKNISQNMKNNFSLKFEEMSDPNTKIFIEKIKLINNIYNNIKNIYFDKDKIYLEIMK